jgi:hypothetical protein
MDFIDDFDFSILKYKYSLNDIYKLIITIKVDEDNILENINVTIKDGYKKICRVDIDNDDYKISLERKDYIADSYTWSVSCETKKTGSGLI